MANSIELVTPEIVSSPSAVTETGFPSAAVDPKSIGALRVKVALGNSSVFSAPRAALSRRLSSVTIFDRSATISAATSVVASIRIEPVTSLVRPTAVVLPMVVRV